METERDDIQERDGEGRGRGRENENDITLKVRRVTLRGVGMKWLVRGA